MIEAQNNEARGMPFWNTKLERDEATPPERGATPPVEPTPTNPKREEPPMAMLKREELPTNVSPSGELNALLGRGSEFEGKLTFEGTVRIDGKFTGSIITNDVLVVGEGAKVSAEITCGTIIVHGEVVGNVRAKTAIELHHPAKLKGNVETPSLMIEKGVIFEGQSKMENLEKVPSVKPLTPPVSAVKSSGSGGSL
jgi:cytoskeletal protein CcmA (bactofilin family)